MKLELGACLRDGCEEPVAQIMITTDLEWFGIEMPSLAVCTRGHETPVHTPDKLPFADGVEVKLVPIASHQEATPVPVLADRRALRDRRTPQEQHGSPVADFESARERRDRRRGIERVRERRERQTPVPPDSSITSGVEVLTRTLIRIEVPLGKDEYTRLCQDAEANGLGPSQMATALLEGWYSAPETTA